MHTYVVILFYYLFISLPSASYYVRSTILYSALHLCPSAFILLSLCMYLLVLSTASASTYTQSRARHYTQSRASAVTHSPEIAPSSYLHTSVAPSASDNIRHETLSPANSAGASAYRTYGTYCASATHYSELFA